MSKQVLERCYKPVKSLCELRIKLINQDAKRPHSSDKHIENVGKIAAYEDIIDFMNKLVEDSV